MEIQTLCNKVQTTGYTPELKDKIRVYKKKCKHLKGSGK